MSLRHTFAALALLAATACSTVEMPHAPDRLSREGMTDGLNATVKWNGIEGGFWAIYTDDGRALDPHETLPAEFRVENLRVHVKSQALDNVACFHMAGIIVRVTDIRRL